MKFLPNCLSLLRCGFALIVAWLVLGLDQPAPVSGVAAFLPFLVFALVALSDFLDGWLARRLDAVSDFGAFIDPIADKILVAAGLLSVCHVLDWPVLLLGPALVILSRDTGVTLLRLLPGVVLPVSGLAKAKTALELIGLGGLLLGLGLAGGTAGDGPGGLIWISAAAVMVAALLSAMTGWTYLCAYRTWRASDGRR
ncbi:MAG: CDP-alcohol phosphatidyltransferase family protein [Henriciella sp.]|jgi:CDP-diacylglycerol--glycerol-3-phosphate 3-phosphatidyltransferase